MDVRNNHDLRRVVGWYLWHRFTMRESELRRGQGGVTTPVEYFVNCLIQVRQIIDMGADEYRCMSFKSSVYEVYWRIVFNREGYRKSTVGDYIEQAIEILKNDTHVKVMVTDIKTWIPSIYAQHGIPDMTVAKIPRAFYPLIEQYYAASTIIQTMLSTANDKYWNECVMTTSALSSQLYIKALDLARPVHTHLQIELIQFIGRDAEELSREEKLRQSLAAQSSMSPEVIEQLKEQLVVDEPPKPKRKYRLLGGSRSGGEKHKRNASSSSSPGNEGRESPRPRSDRPEPTAVPVNLSPSMSPRIPTNDLPYAEQAALNQVESDNKKALIDHFARYCWRKLEEFASTPQHCVIYDVLNEYVDPQTHQFLQNESHASIILDTLSQDIRKSNLIRSNIEGIIGDILNFESELRTLLDAKYSNRSGGFEAHASADDYMHGHRLCVLISIISGLSVKRRQLEDALMGKGRDVKGNAEIQLYDRACQQLRESLARQNAQFMGMGSSNGRPSTPGRDRTRSISSPEFQALAFDSLLDSATLKQ